MAILIVSIGAAGLMSSIGYGFSTVQRVRENQRATQILLEKAETIRLYNWDQVNTAGFIPSTFTSTYDSSDPPTNGYKGTVYYGYVFNLPFNPSGPAPSYSAKLRNFYIVLRWGSPGVTNLTRFRVLNTYIAKDGIQNYVY